MLGYSITVLAQAPENAETPEGRQDRRDVTLAYWFGGDVRWLFDLVRDGKAKEYKRSGGYPDLYTAKAGDVVPILRTLPELGHGVVAHRNRIVGLDSGVHKTIYPDRIAACPPDRVLTLELWDQS